MPRRLRCRASWRSCSGRRPPSARSAPTPRHLPEKLEAIRRAVRDCRERFGDVAGIGVVVAGIVRAGRVTSMNMDWQEYPLEEALAIQDVPLLVENDMNAGALGEITF